MTNREENVFLYVAGFIPYSLRKIYSRLHGKEAETVMHVIQSWKSPSDNSRTVRATSFLDYTRKWTEEKNRGGLFVVNDDFYIFIRRLENIARTCFNKELIETYRGEDLRNVLTPKMLESKLLIESWETLSRNIENSSLAKSLLRLIVNKWVNIRNNAFAEAWVNIIKTKFENTASEKAQPAMRKSLP